MSCASEDFCVAVGEEPLLKGKRHHTQKMAQYAVFNGSAWSPVSGVPGVVRLQNVSCVSSSFCLATSEGQSVTFDGSIWSSPTALPISPEDVSCASETFCVAVEEAEGYVATFNGSSWSSPSQIAPKEGLNAISCVSASYCVAVSNRPAGTGHTHIFDGQLMEHRAGRGRWRRVALDLLRL